MSPQAAERLGRWMAYANNDGGRDMTDDEHSAWCAGEEPPDLEKES